MNTPYKDLRSGTLLPASPVFTYHHTVSFEETNVVGNVYFARHVAWQGRCRELFLKQYAPEVLIELTSGLRLVTLNVSCEYFAELHAFDEVEIELSILELSAFKVSTVFDYFLSDGAQGTRTNVAKGKQDIGCMRVSEMGLLRTHMPESLIKAFTPFLNKLGI